MLNGSQASRASRREKEVGVKPGSRGAYRTRIKKDCPNNVWLGNKRGGKEKKKYRFFFFFFHGASAAVILFSNYFLVIIITDSAFLFLILYNCLSSPDRSGGSII
jgi:hypothetical protein